MIVDILPPGKLRPEHIQCWNAIQQASELLTSPFLSSDFVQAVGRHRDDIRVGVLREAETVTGFFPYQMGRRGIGWPVAYRLNDFQAAICEPNTRLDVPQLLRGCALKRCHFDHLLTSQPWFHAYHTLHANSPYVDISDGFETYAAQSSVRSRVKDAAMKGRRLHRDVGALHFDFHTSQSDVFESLVAWKSEQLRLQKGPNVLESDWVIALLNDLRHSDSSKCRGILSTLRAGDRLVAVHLGLHNRRTFHWWFSAYDPQYGRYSPGSILLLKIIEAAAASGMVRVDLGKGDEIYKKRLQSGVTDVAEALSLARLWMRWSNVRRIACGAQTRSGKLQQPVRSLKRLYERLAPQSKR